MDPIAALQHVEDEFLDIPESLFYSSMSMKVPRIVEEAKNELANGNCVVIGLQTTGEVFELLQPFCSDILL